MTTKTFNKLIFKINCPNVTPYGFHFAFEDRLIWDLCEFLIQKKY